ncbi:transposase [Candidatus Bipolaricaulota bacterium]|nr:transposase [Candidatus Bipolaricaulota bacterium]
MARPLRLEFDGAIYHITSRGNALDAIFFSDRDRDKFLEILEKIVERFGWICHAYCLMTNHYHLLIETPDANLSQGMRQLNGIYTQWINREYGRTGHVFQGRFKSILIQKESHLLEVARYVVLNPVRAGMVRNPRDWRWSSYCATAGQAEVPEILSVAWLLCQFDSDIPRAIRAYRRFVRQGYDATICNQLQNGNILGSADFVNQLAPLFSTIRKNVDIPRSQRLAGRPTLETIFAGVVDIPTRNKGIYEATRIHQYRLKEVGDFLGLYYSTISAIAKRLAESNTPRKKT